MNTYKVLNMGDTDYPKRLEGFRDMPKTLYVSNDFFEVPSVAIVGARICSGYGKRHAYEVAKYLAGEGVNIISGMAYGIDSMAHQGALDAGGVTTAVLGCGIDICYPKRNKSLYEQIKKTGVICSEYELGTEPMPYYFPYRNRIISAMSDIVLVIEAEMKSGSIITADWALDQGVSVWALPGRLGDRLSEGTNALISQGAQILCNYEELLAAARYNFEFNERAKPRRLDKEKMKSKAAEGPDLSAYSKEYRDIYEKMSDDPVDAERLSLSCKMSVEHTEDILISMLMEGLIAEPSPGMYVRVFAQKLSENIVNYP